MPKLTVSTRASLLLYVHMVTKLPHTPSSKHGIHWCFLLEMRKETREEIPESVHLDANRDSSNNHLFFHSTGLILPHRLKIRGLDH